MKKFRLLFLIIAAMLAGTQAGVAQNWKGSTPTELKNAAGNDIDTQSEDANFFLYNVGTGKFLTIGGLWGTQAVLKDVGLLLTMSSSINAAEKNGDDIAYSVHTKYSIQSEPTKNYVQFMDGSNSTSVHDEEIWYTDRLYNTAAWDNQIKDDRSKDFATFYFHSLGNNKYNIYVMSNSDASPDPNDEGFVDKYKSKRIYLVAPTGATNNTGIGAGVTENTSTAYSEKDENAQWILVSLSEVRDNFRSQTANATEAVPADGSYIIRCQNFSRNNGDLSQWRVGPVKDNHLLSTNYSSSIFDTKNNRMLAPGKSVQYNDGTTTNIYIGNGYAVDDNSSDGYYDNTTDKMDASKNESHQKLYGGYWTTNIQGPGTIWQQIYVPIETAGWYIITCDGFTTATKGRVYLFAATTTTQIPDNGELESVDYEDFALGDFNLNSSAPATYTAAGQMLMNDGYQKNAMIYIDPADSKYGGKAVYLIMGVQATGEAGTAGANNPVDATAWTCVDNFEVKYAGSQQKYIILDETKTSIDYINKQVDKNNSYPMRLGRTFTANVWNSFILPVSLTAQQVKIAFGDNTKLSVKDSDTQDNANIIEFKSVNLNVADNTIVLNAGTPYIIKPSIEPRQEAGTFTAVDGTEMLLNEKHYLINQVTLDTELTSADVVSEEYTCGNAGKLTFNGTYTTQNNKIPDGSYLLSGGKWYHMTLDGGTVATVQGFRTWLEPVDGTANANIQFAIDGVIEGDTTNSIEGIENNNNSKANNKVYNMNGQLIRSGSTSLEGLPKGVYIVNNKKYIVK